MKISNNGSRIHFLAKIGFLILSISLFCESSISFFCPATLPLSPDQYTTTVHSIAHSAATRSSTDPGRFIHLRELVYCLKLSQSTQAARGVTVKHEKKIFAANFKEKKTLTQQDNVFVVIECRCRNAWKVKQLFAIIEK